MKQRKANATQVKTSFMELLEELTSLTNDDSLVIATLKNIFATHKVRFGRQLAPVKLVQPALRLTSLRRGNLGRRSSAWA
jgi:hypothetical protein